MTRLLPSPSSTRGRVMYGQSPASAGDSDRTAFRKAEKKYKLYKVADKKGRKVYAPTDLSDVVDFNSVLELCDHGEELPAGIYRLDCDFDRPVFCFESRPGFYFIPGALSVEDQCHWVKESLTEFPQPPNRTNHTAIYGPISDLFLAARNKKVLVEEENLVADAEAEQSLSLFPGNGLRWVFRDNSDVPKGYKSVAASVLLRKLRWSTLGLQFNWTKRNYDVSFPHKKISDKLSLLAKKLAMPAMTVGTEFSPEGAIVNYFGEGDMLGGHIDDMEADWTKPIVSISLGCKAVFLLGGKTRDDAPLAMFLRSGDVVLMAGQARECFHGIPRIFSEERISDTSNLMNQLSNPDDVYYSEYIRTSRININIRQVF